MMWGGFGEGKHSCGPPCGGSKNSAERKFKSLHYSNGQTSLCDILNSINKEYSAKCFFNFKITQRSGFPVRFFNLTSSSIQR